MHIYTYIYIDKSCTQIVVYIVIFLVILSMTFEFRWRQGQYMSTTDLWLTSVWSVGWSDTGTEIGEA